MFPSAVSPGIDPRSLLGVVRSASAVAGGLSAAGNPAFGVVRHPASSRPTRYLGCFAHVPATSECTGCHDPHSLKVRVETGQDVLNWISAPRYLGVGRRPHFSGRIASKPAHSRLDRSHAGEVGVRTRIGGIRANQPGQRGLMRRALETGASCLVADALGLR